MGQLGRLLVVLLLGLGLGAGCAGDDGSCDDGDGFTSNMGDCDDCDVLIFPGAQELCDGVDNDCDNATDEDYDQDLDGSFAGVGCADVYAPDQLDCDDNDATLDRSDADGDGVTPCDGDCDDQDFMTWPGAPEHCDSVDHDCDGVSASIELCPTQCNPPLQSWCDGGCPSLDEMLEELACPDPPDNPDYWPCHASVCGAFTRIRTSSGFDGFDAFFDDSCSLVAVRVWNDAPGYCFGTEEDMWYGPEQSCAPCRGPRSFVTATPAQPA